jgi:uncharacterized damage-inducible protein DinB
MAIDFKETVWMQFGAAIDTLKKAILACPEEVWFDRSLRPEFWHVASHTLFWLDFYLSDSPESFTPPAPFGLEELDPAGAMPESPFSQEDLLDNLERLDVTFAELLLYNMRHVQHHAAQLNLILRRTIDSAPRWTRRAED